MLRQLTPTQQRFLTAARQAAQEGLPIRLVMPANRAPYWITGETKLRYDLGCELRKIGLFRKKLGGPSWRREYML